MAQYFLLLDYNKLNMKINNILTLGFLAGLLLVTACNQKSNSNNNDAEIINDLPANAAYAPPKAPDNIQGEEAKITYVFNHFWDNFNFRDTSKVFDPNYGEQAAADYIGHFPLVQPDTLKEGIEALFNEAKIENSVFEFFKFQFDNYLANPNSPMRNDLYYETFLDYLIGSGKLSPEEKIKYETLLPLLRKNKPGTLAADFNFLTPDGTTSSLNAIKAPFTMLIFYEPGCSNCEETIGQIKSNPGFNAVLEKGALKILALYPDGNKEIWESYQKNIPSNWINGLDEDQTVVTKGLYMIKATPTIYLMDENKKVILKDSNLNQVVQFFQNI